MTHVASLRSDGERRKNGLKPYNVMQCNDQSTTIKKLIALACRSTGIHLFIMPQAHLLDIRKSSLQLTVKSLVHSGADFLCPKCSKNHLQASLITKFFPGLPGLPLNGGKVKGDEARRRKGMGGSTRKAGRVASWLWGTDAPSGVASYGALGHVPLLDFQQFHF